MADKEEIARIEKYAQAHLDRAQAVWAAASKVALAWVVALFLLWTQKIEPAKSLVRIAQARGNAYNTSIPRADSLNYAVKQERAEDAEKKYDAALTAARNPDIEFPFSIKFKLFVEWIPTLWLGLALGLALYLFHIRRQVFSLVARGLKLFSDAESTPAFVRTTVGETPLWLAPPPVDAGSIGADEFKRGLRIVGRSQRNATVFIVVCAMVLVGMELRIFYTSFCIGSYFVATPLPQSLDYPPSGYPASPGHPVGWLLLNFLNILLFCAFLVTLGIWFAPARVNTESEYANKSGDRRAFVGLVLKASAAGLFAMAVSMLGFSTYDNAGLLQSRGKTLRGPRKRKRKHGSPTSYPPLADGLYKNPKTGTIHMAAASCRSCMKGLDPKKLITVEPADVPWETAYEGIQPLGPERASDATAKTGGPEHIFATNKEPLTPIGHLHQQHRSVLIEQHAVALIQQGHSDDACRLLARALASHVPSEADLRIYDLLAGLSIRTQQPDAMSSLIRAATSFEERLHRVYEEMKAYERFSVMNFLYKLSGNRIMVVKANAPYPRKGKSAASISTTSHTRYLENVIAVRIAKWQNPGSRWHRRWSDRSKKITWRWSNGSAKSVGSIEIS